MSSARHWCNCSSNLDRKIKSTSQIAALFCSCNHWVNKKFWVQKYLQEGSDVQSLPTQSDVPHCYNKNPSWKVVVQKGATQTEDTQLIGKAEETRNPWANLKSFGSSAL